MLINAKDYDWSKASDAHLEMLAKFGSKEAAEELKRRAKG
jgi:hypothetical protein